MRGITVVPSSLNAIMQRLLLLTVSTVTLVMLGDLFYLKVAVKHHTLPSANMAGNASHPTQPHLKPDKKFPRATHELQSVRYKPTPEHKFAMEGPNHTKEKHKLTNRGLEVATSKQLQETPRAAEVTNTRGEQSPYRYIINEPHLCTTISNLYIINLVATAPQDQENRTLIRRMWGNKMWTKSTGFRTVFLVGKSVDPRVMAAVKDESLAHHDIIQFSIFDTYNNLTLKVLSGLHWVENFCSTPVWVLKSDTDVIINIFLLSRFLQAYDETTNHTRSQFICNTKWKAFPCRPNCYNPKFVVSWKEYPHHTYPPFCHGSGYVLPRRMVGPLYQAANKTHPFRLEDVYYTGILPERLQWQSAYRNVYRNYPRRPKKWRKSFATSDLMIMEVELYLGPNATIRVWHSILQKQGFLFDLKKL